MIKIQTEAYNPNGPDEYTIIDENARIDFLRVSDFNTLLKVEPNEIDDSSAYFGLHEEAKGHDIKIKFVHSEDPKYRFEYVGVSDNDNLSSLKTFVTLNYDEEISGIEAGQSLNIDNFYYVVVSPKRIIPLFTLLDGAATYSNLLGEKLKDTILYNEFMKNIYPDKDDNKKNTEEEKEPEKEKYEFDPKYPFNPIDHTVKQEFARGAKAGILTKDEFEQFKSKIEPLKKQTTWWLATAGQTSNSMMFVDHHNKVEECKGAMNGRIKFANKWENSVITKRGIRPYVLFKNNVKVEPGQKVVIGGQNFTFIESNFAICDWIIANSRFSEITNEKNVQADYKNSFVKEIVDEWWQDAKQSMSTQEKVKKEIDEENQKNGYGEKNEQSANNGQDGEKQTGDDQNQQEEKTESVSRDFWDMLMESKQYK